jgi:hypothetical protein
MSTGTKPAACLKCARHKMDWDNASDRGWYCEAYPDGSIPDDILVGANAHTGPVPGDHGVRFEPRKRS